VLRNSDFSSKVVVRFERWANETMADCDSLFEYFAQWVEMDRFPYIHDYPTLLEAFLAVVSAYEDDPTILDFKGELLPAQRGQIKKPRHRRAKRIFDSRTSVSPARELMDRRLFVDLIETCRRR
jgi:hypothetical protein